MTNTANTNDAAANNNNVAVGACEKCQDLFPCSPDQQMLGTIAATRQDVDGDPTGDVIMLCDDCCDGIDLHRV